jgi:uncharacterized membrane protein YadS
MYKKEDWWALWMGLIFFLLALPSYYNIYILGWIPSGVLMTPKWTNPFTAFVTIPKEIGGWGIFLLWIFLLITLIPAAKLTGVKISSWSLGFTVIYWISILLWILAGWAPITSAMGSPEIGFILALLVGMVIGNIPRVPTWLKDSAKGEFFIKTAIVLLGSEILFTVFLKTLSQILIAVFISFPIVWIFAFFVSRKIGLDRNLAATLSSGVGVCGIAAAIATAGAIGAPAIYPTMVSSLIVIFAAIELLILPIIASQIFHSNPAAAGAWMGLSVKTDGAAAASGSVVSGLLGTDIPLKYAVMTKVMIDIWIGLIAFILACIWVYILERKPGVKVSPLVLWYRFPKFVLGYFFTSIALSSIALTYPTVSAGEAAVTPVILYGARPLRIAFFALTFTAIGINTRFSKLKESGLGKATIAYLIALLFAITWGGIVAYLLIH